MEKPVSIKKGNRYGKILFALACAGYLVIAIRLINIQVFRDSRSLEATTNRYQRVVDNTLATERRFRPLRGNIYSRNGSLMATTLYHYRIFADGSLIGPGEKEKTLALLGDIAGDELKRISREIERKSRYIPVARRVEPDAEEIAALNACRGIFVREDDAVRYYPMGSLGAHVLGYVNYAGQSTGAEKAFDMLLSGVGVTDMNALPDDGADVVLTVDTNIQYFLEEALRWGYEEFSPLSVSGVVLDPKTGEILAMGSFPSFDPNRFFDYAGSDKVINRAIAHSFEPGSSFKLVTLAAALQEDAAGETDIIDCEGGVINYKGEWIRDTLVNKKLTFSEVFQRSSNVGVIKLADKLGKEKLYYYAKLFGFTEKKSLELPNEAMCRIKDVEKWVPAELGTFSIGYGMAVNLLRLTAAYTVPANGGLLPELHVVNRVDYSRGATYHVKPVMIRRVLDKKAASRVRKILRDVVEKGLNDKASPRGVPVAGKTGTATKYDSSRNQYDRSRVVGTFIGFFPADDPQYVIGIMMDEPSKGGYASQFAVPVFKKAAEQVARYGGL